MTTTPEAERHFGFVSAARTSVHWTALLHVEQGGNVCPLGIDRSGLWAQSPR
jgi:hypothetical protein